MEGSRQFFIGEREFEFDENEGIFFRKAPIASTEFRNTNDGCNTCKAAWQKATDLHQSHCEFCGVSNCKNCMKKTRVFYTDPKASVIGP